MDGKLCQTDDVQMPNSVVPLKILVQISNAIGYLEFPGEALDEVKSPVPVLYSKVWFGYPGKQEFSTRRHTVNTQGQVKSLKVRKAREQ